MSDDTFTVSTPTSDILKFVEGVLFNEAYETSEDMLQGTLIPLYGVLILLHLAGYDKEKLMGLFEDSIDTAYPLMKDVKEQYEAMMNRTIN